MKVGTDGVLLGAWVNPSKAKAILDIGTGTGLIALMAAQKCVAEIDAIEIDRCAFEQAGENFANSIWGDRLQVFHFSLQEYAGICRKKYDLILSNPPFYSDACSASTAARNIARHSDITLSSGDLISGVLKLLASDGKCCFILPAKEGMDFIKQAETNQLFVKRLTRVKTKPGKSEKRLLIEFGYEMTERDESDLIIQEDDLTWSKEYIELTKDFYLGLKNPVAD